MSDIKPKVFSETPPSEMFVEAFSDHCAGPVRECGCGRTCYDNENSYDSDWWEEKEKLAKDGAHPMSGPVSTMTIYGTEWVIGCPCNKGATYEGFIRNSEIQIARYLNARSAELKEYAEKIKIGPHSHE